MAKEWFILHTYTGHERKVKKRIDAQIAADNIADIHDIVVPAEQFTEIRDGKKRQKTRIFLPGYLLLEIDMHDNNWQEVCDQLYRIEGVTSFVGVRRGSRPLPMTAEEARDILRKVGEIKGGDTNEGEARFAEGESVRIIGGPFESFTGTIDEIDGEKEKLRVLVGIFGRITPVEVNAQEVERV